MVPKITESGAMKAYRLMGKRKAFRRAPGFLSYLSGPLIAIFGYGKPKLLL